MRRFHRVPARLPLRPPLRPQLRRSFVVRIPVPRSLKIRTVRLLPSSPKIPLRANRRIPLIPMSVQVARRNFVMRKVRVVAPRRALTVRRPAARWTSYAGKRSMITVHSQKSTRKVLYREYNRVRQEERKTRRITGRLGQVESLRSDRSGMVAAAVHKGLSPQVIADTALVSRALYGD